MIDKGHCYVNMMGENALEYAHFFDFTKSEKEPKLMRLLLEENEPKQNYQSLGELVLPNGSVIGKRTLTRLLQ